MSDKGEMEKENLVAGYESPWGVMSVLILLEFYVHVKLRIPMRGYE